MTHRLNPVLIKSLFRATLTSALLTVSSSHASLTMEDAVTNAAVGSNLGSAAPWGGSSSQIKVAAGNLVYTGLLSPTNAGNLANLLGTSGGSSYRAFNGSAVTTGTIYYSFLIQSVGAPGSSGYLTGLVPSGTTSGAGSGDPLAVYFSASGNGYKLGIHKGSGAPTTNGATVLTTNLAQFVVVKYVFGAGTGDDTVSLYINPLPGDPEPASPDASQSGGTDAANLQNIYLKSSSGYGSWNFDTFRAGTTWADVTPPDNATNGTAPSVSFSSSDVSAYVGQTANFSIVSDGTAPLSYQWYFNTNTLLTDATNSALTLTNVQTTNSGAYFCIVTNAFGADTSDVVRLTVTIPVPPSILAQPQDVTVHPGATATFSVSADGSTPLNYQWYFNTNTAIAGANDATLTLNNVQTTNAGTYSVVINNLAGSTNSTYAALTIDNSPVAPTFVSQPANVIALLGGTAVFSASASGTAPIYYQWLKNGSAISSATNTTLTLTNVQNSDAGTYSLRATNSVGLAMSSNATLTVTVASTLPYSSFNLTGFGNLTTGGGVIPETDAAYRKVTNALDLANAILAANKTAGAVKVIEIMNDLDLGWNEVGSSVQLLASTPFRAHNAPQLHPKLLVTGVSLIDIKPKGGLTIFSANGATIRHATFNIKSCSNIIVRNLKFDEMWEWDEATKGNYDKNDWDFIDIANGGSVSNVWVDHCTFTKSYDGILDTKAGGSAITISWCTYLGDDGATNSNSFVWQQINSLESNKTAYAFYNFLRSNGFSPTDIVTIIQGHDKTHLAGANSLDSANNSITMTFHHLLLNNVWDRCVPRLRGGNVHDYNIYVDDTLALAARNLRNAKASLLSSNTQNTLNNTYHINPPINGAISTESGAVLVEKSVYINNLWPLRNNQTDPTDPTYTGKIMALDSIYQFGNTYFRGNSTDPGGTNTFGPKQAPIITFSWNLSGNQLPYSYTTDDPSQLQSIVAAGAGAGVVNWNKTNWMLTTYAATAPVINAQPQSQSVSSNNSVTFTVLASGSGTLFYHWYFNTNTLIAGATNSTLTLNSVQATNAGTYRVIVSNSVGSVTSAVATLTVSSGATGFTLWQSQQFTSEQLADPNISGPDATPAGDGVPNVVKYSLGLAPFTPVSQPLTTIHMQNGEGVLSYNRPISIPDITYEVDVSTNLFLWTTNGVTQSVVGTNNDGLQIWNGNYTGAASALRFYRLLMIK